MNLSKSTIGVLVDMIENKLAGMQVGDREELKEVMTLQHCLGELQNLAHTAKGAAENRTLRGRRRKLSDMMDDYSSSLQKRA